MKTELIEYHRNLAIACRHDAKLSFTGGRTKTYLEKAEFHERAVAWLESFQEPVHAREPKVYSKT
jgi:hypothetical protein